MARNYLPARGMELRLRFFRVLMCIFVVLFVLFWTVLTISRSRFLFKAPHTIFICIFYNKHHSTSVIYQDKNVVQSTTISVFNPEYCNYHNKTPALTAPLAHPSKISFIRTHPTPPARAQHHITRNHNVVTQRHQNANQNTSALRRHPITKPKRKTGNCEENRSFVECGVILAIFLFLVLE